VCTFAMLRFVTCWSPPLHSYLARVLRAESSVFPASIVPLLTRFGRPSRRQVAQHWSSTLSSVVSARVDEVASSRFPEDLEHLDSTACHSESVRVDIRA
jgi:hypothetical protein